MKFPEIKNIASNQTLSVKLKVGLFVIIDATNGGIYVFAYTGGTRPSLADTLTEPDYNKYQGGEYYYIENHTGNNVEFHVYSFA